MATSRRGFLKMAAGLVASGCAHGAEPMSAPPGAQLRPRHRPPISARSLSPSLPEGLKKYAESAEAAVAQEFKGISTDGRVVLDLFPIQKTGVNGLALMRSLSPTQRSRTILGPTLPGELFTAAFHDNFEMRYEGIRFAELSSVQHRLLLRLVDTYVGRIRPGHAEVKSDEVKRHYGKDLLRQHYEQFDHSRPGHRH